MPKAPLRPCTFPGCGALVDAGRFCDRHRSHDRKASDARRGSSAARGYGHKWQEARDAFLRTHPLCEECKRVGIVKAASVVDHVIPHKGDKKIFWNRSNWQALCNTHHNSKTASQDGGFGNLHRPAGEGGTKSL